jgi:hypothetical protein
MQLPAGTRDPAPKDRSNRLREYAYDASAAPSSPETEIVGFHYNATSIGTTGALLKDDSQGSASPSSSPDNPRSFRSEKEIESLKGSNFLDLGGKSPPPLPPPTLEVMISRRSTSTFSPATGAAGGRKRSQTIGMLSSSPPPTYLAAVREPSSSPALPQNDVRFRKASLPDNIGSLDRERVLQQPRTGGGNGDDSQVGAKSMIATASKSESEASTYSQPTTASVSAPAAPRYYGRGGAGSSVKPSQVKAKEKLEKLTASKRVTGIENKLKELRATDAEVRPPVHGFSFVSPPFLTLTFTWFSDRRLAETAV